MVITLRCMGLFINIFLQLPCVSFFVCCNIFSAGTYICTNLTRTEENKMFIKTIKLKKPNYLAIALLAAIACLVVIVGLTAYKLTRKTTYELGSEQQRQQFIKEMGWETEKEFSDCKKVTIPQEFNQVYESYNELQKQQGFDLTPYKGKECDIYTYKITNYKDHEDKGDVVCNLMICDNKLIGGDVCSTQLDGFMQGLKNKDK